MSVDNKEIMLYVSLDGLYVNEMDKQSIQTCFEHLVHTNLKQSLYT